MIPTDLQDNLQLRCLEVFKDKYFLGVNEGKVPLNIFKQHLPEKKKSDRSLYPYILIKLIEGEVESDDQQAKVDFIIGTYDEGTNNQGYRDVCMIIQKIFEDFKKHPRIDGEFELQFPMKWIIHDEDVQPYYFGAIETLWGVPTLLREDVEAMI